MSVKTENFYKPKLADGNLAGMIKIKGAGDFFTKRFEGARGCCEGPSGWAEYSARLKIPAGALTSDVMEKIAVIAREYGREEIYLTARMGMEIPGVAEERLGELQEALSEAGVLLARCGPCIRSIAACKGTFCIHGNIDTFRIAWEIDQLYNDGATLPHKFKVGVVGCANSCIKPRLNDIGLIGVSEPRLDIDKCDNCGLCIEDCLSGAMQTQNGIVSINKQRCVDCGDCVRACLTSAITTINSGVDIYVGGRWGRTKQVGLRIARFLTEADAVQIVGRIKKWYCANGNRGERLGAVILRKGVGTLQETVLQKIKMDKWVNITAESQAAFQIIT